MSDAVITWPGHKLDFSHGPLLMGILNVTPDSFSDGGQWTDPSRAVAHAEEMVRQGAAVIDIGPESSRPGSEPVSINEQIRRAVPIIEKVAAKTPAVISIDTRSSEVAKAALDAGAAIINDITALADEDMIELAAKRHVPVILMHMQGKPQTMQASPTYKDVVTEVRDFLVRRARTCEQGGIAPDRIFIDPGIGFGKTTQHNLLLLQHLDAFVETGYRVLLGASRKRFIGQITGRDDPAQRVHGTAATTALAVAAGVSLIRVHDVAAMADVLKVANAICRGTP